MMSAGLTLYWLAECSIVKGKFSGIFKNEAGFRSSPSPLERNWPLDV